MKRTQYFKWGLTVFLTVCAVLVFYDTFYQAGTLQQFVSKLASILAPVLYGFAIAYLLTPIMSCLERAIAALWKKLFKKELKQPSGALRLVSILLTEAVVIFLLYLWAVSHMKDVERMFAYHGAEHKTIFCYEKGLPLTVENVRPQSRFHPRCGTSFLFVVVIISILVFSLVSLRVGLWDNPWVRIGLRLLLLPVVVSISYEINRWVGRHDNLCSRILSAPGKWLQRLTTNEPDDSMIECAIRALELVIPEQKGSDTW